jgi:Uma2 family endonuclease
MRPAEKRATYEDLLRLGEDVRAEILDGEILEKAAPLPEHGFVQNSFGSVVGSPFGHGDGGGPGGWWILTEVEVRLSARDVVRPDVVGFRRERLPSPWGMRPIDVVPDWICEILSPSNASRDRVRKRRLYARSGVAHYWIVDPADRTLEALRLEGKNWIELGVYDDEDTARIPPFDAIELIVARLFPPRTAPPAEP